MKNRREVILSGAVYYLAHIVYVIWLLRGMKFGMYNASSGVGGGRLQPFLATRIPLYETYVNEESCGESGDACAPCFHPFYVASNDFLTHFLPPAAALIFRGLRSTFQRVTSTFVIISRCAI